MEVETFNIEVRLRHCCVNGFFGITGLDRKSEFRVEDAGAGQAMSVWVDAGRETEVDGLNLSCGLGDVV